MNGPKLAQFNDFAVFGFEPAPGFDLEYGQAYPPQLYVVTNQDGRKYVSDRYTALLDGMVVNSVGNNWLGGSPTVDLGTIPDNVPALSTRRLRPKTLHRLTDLGITVHQGEKAQHLYRDGDHVGYQGALERGSAWMTVADIPAVQRFARHMTPFIGPDDQWDEWDLAAAIVQGERLADQFEGGRAARLVGPVRQRCWREATQAVAAAAVQTMDLRPHHHPGGGPVTDSRILPRRQAEEVDRKLYSLIADAHRWENRELLDESQCVEIHALAASIYAAGYNDGIESEYVRRSGQREREYAAVSREVTDSEQVSGGDDQ